MGRRGVGYNHVYIVYMPHGMTICMMQKMLVLELLSGGDLAKELIRMRPKR